MDAMCSSLGDLFSNPFDFLELDTGITYHSDWADPGSLPSASFNAGSFPTLNSGSWPSISVDWGDVSISGGSWPSLSGGSMPSLSFNGGSLPSFSEPFTFNTPSLSVDTDLLESKFNTLINNIYDNQIDYAIDYGLFSTVDPIALATFSLRLELESIANDDGVTYGSKGADYAEWLPKLDPEEYLPRGSVVGVYGGKISLETEGADQIMAISSTPIVLGNIPPEGKEANYAKTGFLGQIPVLVRGRVDLGDFIIPSGYDDGTGIAIKPEEITLAGMSTVLGRAWSASEKRELKLIRV